MGLSSLSFRESGALASGAASSTPETYCDEICADMLIVPAARRAEIRENSGNQGEKRKSGKIAGKAEIRGK